MRESERNLGKVKTRTLRAERCGTQGKLSMNENSYNTDDEWSARMRLDAETVAAKMSLSRL